jgi:hypothetical protein
MGCFGSSWLTIWVLSIQSPFDETKLVRRPQNFIHPFNKCSKDIFLLVKSKIS